MTLALITAKQVIVLFILIFSGFICVKTGAVKIEGRKAFSDLLVYFVVPCMIINSYLTEFDDNIFKNILYALGLSILLLVVGFAITFLLSFKLKGDNVPIVRFGTYICKCLCDSIQYFFMDTWIFNCKQNL